MGTSVAPVSAGTPDAQVISTLDQFTRSRHFLGRVAIKPADAWGSPHLFALRPSAGVCRAEPALGLVARFVTLSQLPQRVSLRLPVGTLDAQGLIGFRSRQAVDSRRQVWNSGLLRAGVPFSACSADLVKSSVLLSTGCRGLQSGYSATFLRPFDRPTYSYNNRTSAYPADNASSPRNTCPPALSAACRNCASRNMTNVSYP